MIEIEISGELSFHFEDENSRLRIYDEYNDITIFLNENERNQLKEVL